MSGHRLANGSTCRRCRRRSPPARLADPGERAQPGIALAGHELDAARAREAVEVRVSQALRAGCPSTRTPRASRRARPSRKHVRAASSYGPPIGVSSSPAERIGRPRRRAEVGAPGRPARPAAGGVKAGGDGATPGREAVASTASVRAPGDLDLGDRAVGDDRDVAPGPGPGLRTPARLRTRTGPRPASATSRTRRGAPPSTASSHGIGCLVQRSVVPPQTWRNAAGSGSGGSSLGGGSVARRVGGGRADWALATGWLGRGWLEPGATMDRPATCGGIDGAAGGDHDDRQQDRETAHRLLPGCRGLLAVEGRTAGSRPSGTGSTR